MNKIICVVDNAAPKGARLKTEHGVAFWIETDGGITLFDTGQSAKALSHNLSVLNLNAKDIDVVALSHAHYDHTGGLNAVLKKNPGLKIVANTDIFRPKYSLHDGKYDASGFVLSREEIARSAEICLSSEPAEIFPDLWTSGEIRNREEPEGRSAGHYIRDGDKWLPDPYRDDMSLVLRAREGLVVICGCCHAGLLNTLYQVEHSFECPIVAVVGGTHLMTSEGPQLKYVMDMLTERYSNVRLYLNHCTGDDALKALASTFGERLHHFTAGETVTYKG